jgi:phosphatidylinositol 4-phosphatase
VVPEFVETQEQSGAYILSPLEEASRDPVQNAGFVVTWLTSNQTTRVSSYSLRNTLDTPPTLSRSSRGRASTTINSNFLSARGFRRKGATASPLNNVGRHPNAERISSAFKVLPVDPARMRRASTGGELLYAEAADELTGASSCQEAADWIVDSIRRACEDVGVVNGSFVTNEDVVGWVSHRHYSVALH